MQVTQTAEEFVESLSKATVQLLHHHHVSKTQVLKKTFCTVVQCSHWFRIEIVGTMLGHFDSGGLAQALLFGSKKNETLRDGILIILDPTVLTYNSCFRRGLSTR